MKKPFSILKVDRFFDWDVDFSEERSNTFFYPSGYTPSAIDEGKPVPRRAAYLLHAAAFVASFGAVAFFVTGGFLPG
jgi:hypothetical protein